MTAGRLDYRGARVGERITYIESFRDMPIGAALRQRGINHPIPVGQHAGFHINYNGSGPDKIKTDFDSAVWLSMVTTLILMLTSCCNIVFSIQSIIEHIALINNNLIKRFDVNSTYLILNSLVVLFSPFSIIVSMAVIMTCFSIICGSVVPRKCYVLVNLMGLITKMSPLLISFNLALTFYNLYVLPTLPYWNFLLEGANMPTLARGLGLLPGTQWADRNTLTLIINLLILGANMFVNHRGSFYIQLKAIQSDPSS